METAVQEELQPGKQQQGKQQQVSVREQEQFCLNSEIGLKVYHHHHLPPGHEFSVSVYFQLVIVSSQDSSQNVQKIHQWVCGKRYAYAYGRFHFSQRFVICCDHLSLFLWLLVVVQSQQIWKSDGSYWIQELNLYYQYDHLHPLHGCFQSHSVDHLTRVLLTRHQ